MSKPAEFSLDGKGLLMAHVFQGTVFKAYRFHKDDPEHCGFHILGALKHIGEFFGFKPEVQYDETIWNPSDEGSIKNKMRVKFNFYPVNEYYILDIDFRKPMREGVTLIGAHGSTSIDVFSVKFHDTRDVGVDKSDD